MNVRFCTSVCKLIMLILIVSLCASAQAQLQVRTTEGVVEGLMIEQNYIAFYEIPYAGSVDGPNRFKAAPPPDFHPDVFIANYSRIECAHSYGGIENCLTLNIFTSNLTTSSGPVLVYLDASEYNRPITNYIIRKFNPYVEQGFVVVTLRFRLSIFGFLCLRVEQAPGNAGIKDIIQGLEWLNRNIAGFGGDPENVMLIGHASAAALVDIVTMVPRANNLVHKAMTLSGSALAPWAVAYKPVEYAEALGKALGYPKMSPADLAKKLATTSMFSLVHTLDSFTFYNNTPLFAPCIEDENISLNSSVLTDSPINILRAGNYNHIPYIAAYAAEEGIVRSNIAYDWIKEMHKNFTKFLPVDLDFKNDIDGMADGIWRHYFRTSLPALDFQSYQADTLFVVSVIRGARERALTSKADVRLMEFGQKVNVKTEPALNQSHTRYFGHGEIQRFLFGYDMRGNEKVVAESLISRITAFAKHGVPSTPASNPVSWPPITQYFFSYLTYNLYTYNGVPSSREVLSYDPHQSTMSLWNLLYSLYYRPLRPVVASPA